MDAQAEVQRLAALFDYDVFDTPPEPAFDRFTALAAEVLGAPIALISLVGEDRQYAKSAMGAPGGSLPRALTFCDAAIQGAPNSIFVVEDAAGDPRFADQPFVNGKDGLRFYAGATLTTPQGHNIGVLCVMDGKPRPRPSAEALTLLSRLAQMVVGEMEAARDRRRGDANRLLLELVEQISGVGHWRIDGPALKLTWSEQTYRIHGLDPASFQPDFGKALAFYAEEDRERHARAVLDAFASGEGYEMQLKLHRADGSVRDVMLRTRAQAGEDGQVIGLFGVIEDITDHLQSIKAVERSRARYRLLADNMADAVTRIRMDGSSTYISPGIERLIGWSPREMAGRPAQDFTWPEDRPMILATFAEMAAGLDEKTVQHRAQHKDGHPVWVETRFRMVRDQAGRPLEMVAVIRDIGDRKAAEAALEQSETRYRLLAEHATDIIARTHPHGQVLYVTPSVEAVTGFRPDEVVGTNIVDRLHLEDRAGFAQAYGDVVRGLHRPGQAIRYRVGHKDGRWLWIEANPRLVRDPSGRPLEIVDVLRDVTAQVALEAELKEARDQANAAAKAKSEFLANMSHELRTPLTAIIGFSGLLKVRGDLTPQAAMFAARIEGASQALLATINDVLDFSKLEAGQVEIRPSPCDVAALVQEVASVLEQQAASKGLAIETRLTDLPSRLQVDRDRVRQVLLNLMGNAVKFTSQGHVRVSAAFAENGLIVEVADTGPGLTAEQQGLLFQRFSQVDGSASRSHGGTGLGLAICKGLVEAMGGVIGVTSEPGQGAVFRFALPCEPAPDPAQT
ncbi:PAS domain S-box protein [Phenylobacterium sp.]|jgi:PAS domain S-box-containing protein|uniref:PAS domain S-box protein n=1 Tax=Phenylobacterium sp. TaxID=1871053 RepID=UPI002F9437AF